MKPTHDADAASILFNLPGYRVLAAGHVDPDSEDAGRWALVEAVAAEGGCPDCGVLSGRIHARPVQVVKDVPCGGEALEVRVCKRRFRCQEAACARATFVEETDELPFRARFTTRLAEKTLASLRAEPRSIHAVTVESGLSWPTVMGLLTSTVDLATIPEQRLVRRLGVDEHRFRRVRYVRDHDGGVTRVEPWSIMLTGLDTGAILDVVDGRRGPAVKQWLAARPRWWRRRIEYVAMDMSSEFRAAIRKSLPRAKISVDHWHVVRLANDMVTTVRRRRIWETEQRRGRKVDTAWRYRQLLLANSSRLSTRQRARLNEVLDSDLQLKLAWGVKEHVRQLLATRHIDDFHREWAHLERAVKASNLPEAERLLKTLKAWRRELLTFCRTRITNARTEAANLNAKTFKRAGRGYRNHDNYRSRITAYAPTRTAA
ncbi:ISL3 family transposase [Nocardioides caeni]